MTSIWGLLLILLGVIVDALNPVARERKIPIDMEKMFLKVRTKSTAGSNDLIQLRLYNQDDTFKSVKIKFTDVLTYKIEPCMDHCLEFPVEPTLMSRTNFVIKTTSKGIRIFCGWVEVLDLELSDEMCSESSDWRDLWEKKIVAVYCDSTDTGSYLYQLKLFIRKIYS
ncbi:hypothetical protein ACHWQZ_G001867 [Mnemiopsis leidyi]